MLNFRPFSHAFFRKCPETTNLNQNSVNRGKLTDCDPNLKYVISSHKVIVFHKFNEIWVKTLGDIAPRSVTDRQTDRWTDGEMERQTKAFIELLAAVKKLSQGHHGKFFRKVSPSHMPMKVIFSKGCYHAKKCNYNIKRNLWKVIIMTTFWETWIGFSLAWSMHKIITLCNILCGVSRKVIMVTSLTHCGLVVP